MKENNIHFIKNNKKFRTELKINQSQLSYTIRYLEKTGFLKLWDNKAYQLSHGKNFPAE